MWNGRLRKKINKPISASKATPPTVLSMFVNYVLHVTVIVMLYAEYLHEYAAYLAETCHNQKNLDCLERSSLILEYFENTAPMMLDIGGIALQCGVVLEITYNGADHRSSLHASNFLLGHSTDATLSVIPIDGFFNRTDFVENNAQTPSYLHYIDWGNFVSDTTIYCQQYKDGTVVGHEAYGVRSPKVRLNPNTDRCVVMGGDTGKKALDALNQYPDTTNKSDIPILLLERHWR